MVPHLDMTATLGSGGGAGPAFIIGLLGLDDKRGSNRGNDNKSHCRCHGGSTSPAFVVGLFDVDNKRGGNMWQEGNISRLQQGPIVVVACLASRSRTRVAVGYRGQQAPVRTPGRCAIEIGAMVLMTDAQSHPEW